MRVLIIVFGVLAVALDFAMGPGLQFPVLFVLPVLLAAEYGYTKWALLLATTLPLARLGFDMHWYPAGSTGLLAANAVVRICVLVTVGLAVGRLVRARQEIQTLEGIIPVCAGCKKIRDSEGQWNEMEIYITKRSEAEFSHGMCPECIKIYYDDLESDNA